jgi:hypothetical protein
LLKPKNLNKLFALTLVVSGMVLLVVSTFYVSSFLTIFSSTLVFWGAILLYITPTKFVQLDLLNAIVDGTSSNIERILIELKLTEKGIYLPPKNLPDIESSLIFLSNKHEIDLPSSGETSEKLYGTKHDGIFVTPPGLKLSKYIEQELKEPLLKTNLEGLQDQLSEIFVEKYEFAESFEMRVQNMNIIVELKNSLFEQICVETEKQPLTHSQVGCILSSALACAFAKATGKPITIESESRNLDSRTTTITYHIGEV